MDAATTERGTVEALPHVIRFLQVTALHGPNVWSALPCLQVCVELAAEIDGQASEIDPVVERLARLGNSDDSTSPAISNTVGGNLPPALVRAFGELAQRIQRTPIYDRTFIVHFSAGSAPRQWLVALEYEEDLVGRAALAAARRLVEQALVHGELDFAAATTEVVDLADRHYLGPSTRAIVRAAEVRGIPVRRLNRHNFVQLGHGAQQRRICTAETDRTGAIGEEIASDKELTKQLLQTVGVPVPKGRLVDSAEDAWDAAESVGVPVVVKPRDGNHGRGVFTALTTRAEVEDAYAIAIQEGSGVIVERFALGSEHRLLVIDGALAAATRGDPAVVVGDGQQTIRALVDEQVNSDPRRGDTESCPLARLKFDSVARLLLKQQGFDPDSIPASGQRVVVQYNGNLSVDVTDEVHPEVAARAVEAARMVGLDVAGLDVVAQDISQPLESQGGVIVEVNAGPGLLMHVKPSKGRPRPVGAAIVRSLFPTDPAGRIPLVGVLDDRAGQPLVHAVGRWLSAEGSCAGWACQAGIFVADRRLAAAPVDERQAVEMLLANNRVERAALGVSSRGITAQGLAFNAARVVVVGPTIEPWPEPVGRMAVLRVLGQAVDATGWLVLPVEDRRRLAELPVAVERVVLYTTNQASGELAAHRSAGGATAELKEQTAVITTATRVDEFAVENEHLAPLDRLIIAILTLLVDTRRGSPAAEASSTAVERSAP